MTQNPNPPPALQEEKLYKNAYRWMTGSEEDWREGQRYLDAHQNAFATLPPTLRYDLAVGSWRAKEPLRFERLQRALMAGCRWDDKLEGAGNKWSTIWEYINYSHAIFARDCHHSAAEWLELFRLGGGVPLETEAKVPDTEALTTMYIPLWQVLAVKAQKDTYNGKNNSLLTLILKAAKAAGMPVEGPHEYDPFFWGGKNIAQHLFTIGGDHTDGPVEYMRLTRQPLLDAHVDLAAIWEKHIFQEMDADQLAFKAECDALGKPIRAALLSGKSQAVEKDLRKIACLGQLPQLMKGIAKAGASEELLAACHNLPPYYHEKYRHTIASLPRVAAVEESALAGYARGGAA